jgi:hypothetical protein
MVVTPYDEGVFLNPRREQGRTLVCDPQLYVDLYTYPARGREQAEHLLSTCMAPLQGLGSTETRATFHQFLGFRDQADAAFDRREYDKAIALFKKGLDLIEGIRDPEVGSELRRTRLMLWLALSIRSALLRRPADLHEAEGIFPDESTVRGVQRELMFSNSPVEHGLAAFYLAKALDASSPVERGAFKKRAADHLTILKSPYTEGSNQYQERIAELDHILGGI